MSDLFGNHFVGFLTRWLNYVQKTIAIFALTKLWLFVPGAAGCVATLIHDSVMNPADGKYEHDLRIFVLN